MKLFSLYYTNGMSAIWKLRKKGECSKVMFFCYCYNYTLDNLYILNNNFYVYYVAFLISYLDFRSNQTYYFQNIISAGIKESVRQEYENFTQVKINYHSINTQRKLLFIKYNNVESVLNLYSTNYI